MKVYIINYGMNYEFDMVHPFYFLDKNQAEQKAKEIKESSQLYDYAIVKELRLAIDNELRNVYDGMTDAELSA